MKAILLLCLVAAASSAAIDLVKDTWVDGVAGDNVFQISFLASDYTSRGIVMYVKHVGTPPAAYNIYVTHILHDGDSYLRNFDAVLRAVAPTQMGAIAIPGSFWAKQYTGSSSYTLQFNVSSEYAPSCYFTYNTALPSDEYLGFNDTMGTPYYWGEGTASMVIGSAFTIGIKMNQQYDHYYLRAAIGIQHRGNWDHAYMYNPNDWSFDDDTSISSTDDEVFVRTCVTGSNCELVQGKTYFVRVRVGSDTQTTDPELHFQFEALSGAASVAVSAVLLLAMIALALL